MPRGKPFQPGQSGNPNGRPKKERALTYILEQASSKTVDTPDGKRVARKKLLADYVMQALTTGSVTFPDGRTIVAEFKDWADFAKWLYAHIDGAPKQQIEHSGDLDVDITVKVIKGISMDDL